MLKGLNIHEKMLFSTKNIKYAVLISVLMLLKGQGARPKGQGARPKGQGAFTIFKMRAGCSPLLHPSSSTTDNPIPLTRVITAEAFRCGC